MRRKTLCLILWLAVLLTLAAAESKWQRNVRRNSKGVVYVDNVPQVAQKKNFCAPASVEMVLRYYKNRISQRNLGRNFETDKKIGTYSNGIIKEFNEGRIEGFSIRLLYRMTVRELNVLTTAYREAVQGKRKKKSKRKSANAEVDFRAMDPKIAVPLFTELREPVAELLAREVVKYVDRGQPLLWCVQMNFDPYSRVAAGHMRLIVGYQKSGGTVEAILYRDPWGQHKVIKKMPLNRAAVMTWELLLIEPKKEAAAPTE